jgi:hypothetical protein
MRRFCNYFVTCFNQRAIKPFAPFITSEQQQDIKKSIRALESDYDNDEGDSLQV